MAKQETEKHTVLSTTEAEYMALSATSQKLCGYEN